MPWNLILRVGALVLFVLAGLSTRWPQASGWSVSLLAWGLAAWVASTFIP